MSAAMASRLRRVSNKVSPLLVEDVDTFRLITSADRRWAASSKVVRVRVEFSKNTLHTVLPRSKGLFHGPGTDFQEGVGGVEDLGEQFAGQTVKREEAAQLALVIELQRALGVDWRHRGDS